MGKSSNKKSKKQNARTYNRKEKRQEVKVKKPLTVFEKFILVLVAILVAAFLLSVSLDLDLVIYAALFNYFLIGLVVLIRPELVIEIWQKYNDDEYGDLDRKITYLINALRVAGLALLAVGGFIVYTLFF